MEMAGVKYSMFMLSNRIVHIICSKDHAKELINSGKFIDNLVWLDDEFGITKLKNAIDEKNITLF